MGPGLSSRSSADQRGALCGGARGTRPPAGAVTGPGGLVRRRALLIAVLAATVGAGVAACGGDSKSRASVASSTAHPPSRPATATDVASARFLIHADLAVGAFHHFISGPYRAGALGRSAGHEPARATAAAAALFARRELILAASDVKRSPTLQTLFVPVTLLASKLAALSDALAGGRYRSADIEAASASVAQITAISTAAGAPIKDKSSGSRPGAPKGPRPTVVPRNGAIGPAPSPLRSGRTCASSILSLRVATDRRSYRQGEAVAITVTAHNGGRSPCSLPTGPCLPQLLITRENGVVIWNRAELQVLCNVEGVRRLGAGASTRTTVTWNGRYCSGRTPQSCPGGPASSGSYRVSAAWNSLRHGSATFTERP